MNKYCLLALIVIICGLLFVRTYTSSPGFTTPEYAEEFYSSAPKCYGISFLMNAEAMAADAPGQSLCIGLLK